MKMVLPVDGWRSAEEFMTAMQGSEGDTHWLMKQAEYWHGGIHLYDCFAGNAVFKPGSSGLKCMTDGQVVAWRLNDDYQTATFGKKKLKFSSTFVLIKSTCTPDKDKPDNALDFYTLWMQTAPLSEYGITDTPAATVTASALKIRQDNTSPGWVRGGLKEGGNVPRDALRHYEVPQDTHTTLPRGAVVEIQQEASFLLNGKPAPFIFVSVVSVPEGAKSGLSVGETGWISGLDKFVKRESVTLPGWMVAARKHGVFNQVVTVSGDATPVVKAGEIIGHLSLLERPNGGPQRFCHLEVFSQDARMKDFLVNKVGVTTGAAELHTLADRQRWYHRAKDNSFVVAGVGGDPSPSTAERYTPESESRKQEADGKAWYYIPGELAWMSEDDVERVCQFDLEKRGFMPLEQEDAPQSIFHTPKENWVQKVYRRLEELARSETRDMYSSSYREKYQTLLKQMNLNQDGVIKSGDLWRFLHNTQPHILYQVQRLVVKHHSEWLKDGMSALWQAALDEQAKTHPEMARYNCDFINKLVWMKDVSEIRSGEALWHMHPIVFLDALREKKKRGWAHSPFAELLGSVESKNDYTAYNQVFHNPKRTVAKYRTNLTSMTIRQVMEKQMHTNVMFATGRFQIIPGTLVDAVKALKLDVNSLYDEATQDRIFEEYIIKVKRPAIIAYLEGRGSVEDAIYDWAKEFASAGVRKGNTISKGRIAQVEGVSYYSGDGLNHAHLTPDQMVNVLSESKNGAK